MEHKPQTNTFNLAEVARVQQAIEANEARREHARAEFLDALTGGQGLGPSTIHVDQCIPSLIDPRCR